MVPTEFWVAYRIHAAISGVGTDEETLSKFLLIFVESIFLNI
jgi:hypothetical protein